MAKTTNGRERGKQLVELIYAERARHDTPRRPNSLRPSELGAECERFLWLRFRWSDAVETFGGRMLRLFETGQLQEPRMTKELRSVGAEVYDTDPEDSTRQIKISTFDGHSTGYLDGVAGDIPFAQEPWCALEFKTHSEKSFKMLEKDGVEVSKPRHFAQMQIYLREQDLKEALYVAVNKNTDHLYCEFIAYNEKYTDRLFEKGERIIHRQDIPQRISNQPTFYTCKMCSAHAVCHELKRPPRTCRTCAYGHAATVPEIELRLARKGEWFCEFHERALDLDDQRSGCADHRFHPHIVTGDSSNGGTEVEEKGQLYINYVFNDGSEWMDKGASFDREND